MITLTLTSEPGEGKGILLDAIANFLESEGIFVERDNERQRAKSFYSIRIQSSVKFHLIKEKYNEILHRQNSPSD